MSKRRRQYFGKRSGFESVRDYIIFLIGVAGIAPQIYQIAQGADVNLGALMFFGGFLVAPQVISQTNKSRDKGE